jgi:hypothetical protein
VSITSAVLSFLDISVGDPDPSLSEIMLAK